MELTKESQEIFDRISDAYGIDDPAGSLILQTACESFDLMRLAQESVRKYGVVTVDEKNRPKANPACSVERDSRAAFLQAMRQLKVDIPVQ